MSVVWYWAEGSRREGPMEWAKLRDAARAGEFSPDAWVWTQGYGAEWRRASTLGESLFPKTSSEPKNGAAKGGSHEDSAQASRPSDGSSVNAWSASDSPVQELRERSPFEMPSVSDKPERIAVCRSFAVAVANMCVILFKPAFSFGRFAAFALSAMLLWIGFSTGGAALPGAGQGSEAQNVRFARLGLDSVAAPVSEFIEKHASEIMSPLGDPNPAGTMHDMAGAFRSASAALVAWAGEPGHALLVAVGVVAWLALCAISAWFLSRGWALLLRRVYRRDEPVGVSWSAASVSSDVLFRGAFAVRAAVAAVEAAVSVYAVSFFAALPEGGARGRHVAAFMLALCAVQLFGAIATGFVRDFVVPLVLLRRLAFFRALRTAAGRVGWWFLRYLVMLIPMSIAAQGAAALVVMSLFGAFGAANALAPMFSVAFSFCVVPWQLIRCLWTLDIAFSSDPSLRSAIPPGPRLRMRPLGGRSRYDRGLGGDEN